MTSTTTTRAAALAEVFNAQAFDIEGLLAHVGFDSRSAYAEGHQEWIYDEELREYERRLEGLLRMARYLEGQYKLKMQQQ